LQQKLILSCFLATLECFELMKDPFLHFSQYYFRTKDNFIFPGLRAHKSE